VAVPAAKACCCVADAVGDEASSVATSPSQVAGSLGSGKVPAVAKAEAPESVALRPAVASALAAFRLLDTGAVVFSRSRSARVFR